MARGEYARPVPPRRKERPRAPRISYLVKWVERGLRVRLDEALSDHGVTTPEYTTLSVLRERGGLSSAQLARRAFVTPQAMNLIVIALENRGLVSRTPDAQHRKIQRTSLTVKGTNVLAACDRATLPIEEHLLSSLTRTEVAGLRRALSACAASLKEEDESDAGAA